MNRFILNLRYGARIFFKQPRQIAIAIPTLALGIAANIAIFSVANAVLIKSLPYKDVDRTVNVWEAKAQGGDDFKTMSYANFHDYQTQARSFESLASYRLELATATNNDRPSRVWVNYAQSTLFSMLGVNAALGRVFLPEEDQQTAAPAAVLSYSVWQSIFGGTPDIIGRKLNVDGRIYTVIGTLAQGSGYPPYFKLSGFEAPKIDLWLSFGSLKFSDADRGDQNYFVVGKLKPGVSIKQAESEMTPLARQLEQRYPGPNTGWGAVRILKIHDQYAGDLKLSLLALTASALSLSLIACANVANLLLSLAVGRRKELAVRSAIGASRRALIEQLLTESALLMALSVILGTFMGWGVLRLLPTLSPDSRLQNIGVDWNVLGYILLIAVFSILLFGLAPALFASRFNLNETLKQAGKGSNQGGTREKMRDSLVVCEIALALMLLMVAGLLIRSYIYIKEQGPGFNFQDLTMLSVSLPQTKYPDAERQVNFYRQLRDRLTGLPGVEATAVVVNPPLTKKGWETSFVIENGPPPGETPQAQYHSVSDSYFNLMRIPLLRGRQFTGQPMKQPPPEAIINTALQKRFFPNSDPLGKQLELFGQKFEIVGIVSDVRHFGFEAQNKPEIYVPFERNPDLELSIVVRSRINPKNLLVSLQNEVWQVDKELPINVATMDQLFADSIKQQSFTTLMFGLFAIAAVTIASAGLFGVMAYSVSQRTQEIGIRMALGAQKRDIFRLVLVRGLVLAGIGLGIGVLVSMAITRLTQGLLYGVSATDPLSALLASLLVVLVALVSCYIPARRAMSVDPLVVLRSE